MCRNCHQKLDSMMLVPAQPVWALFQALDGHLRSLEELDTQHQALAQYLDVATSVISMSLHQWKLIIDSAFLGQISEDTETLAQMSSPLWAHMNELAREDVDMAVTLLLALGRRTEPATWPVPLIDTTDEDLPEPQDDDLPF